MPTLFCRARASFCNRKLASVNRYTTHFDCHIPLCSFPLRVDRRLVLLVLEARCCKRPFPPDKTAKQAERHHFQDLFARAIQPQVESLRNLLTKRVLASLGRYILPRIFAGFRSLWSICATPFIPLRSCQVATLERRHRILEKGRRRSTRRHLHLF